MFNQLAYLYQLHVVENNINHALLKEEIVAVNMLNTLKETINIVSSSLRAIDYNPFFVGKNARTIKELLTEIITTQRYFLI